MKICAQSFIADAEHAVRKMLGWLKEVTFSDGSWPMVNDCTQGIAPTTNALLDYAAALDIVPIDTEVQDSGYFFFRGTGWELFIDAANIAPGFQPGHAHADTGTFCLHLYGYPLIVDTGISTYEVSKRRAWERGTVAHNVMSVEGQNSSDVWKSFRVGKRAQVIDITRGNDHLSFAHDGYKKLGIIVRRRFEWSEQHITITDVADGANAGKIPLITALHFHPDVQVTQVSATSFQTDSAIILVEGTSKAWCEPYNYCAGFNQLVPAQRICANPANGQCSLTILLKS